MVKSIVVGLDGTESSFAAERLAVDLAKAHGAVLAGVGVLDVPWITAPQARPIGAGAYKAHRDETLLAKGRADLRARLAAFHKACEAAGVACREIGCEGAPHEMIEREACGHDLILLGRDTNFYGEREHHIDASTERLLRDNPRPVIVVPAERPPGDTVVVAYDGSIQASRAMHMFVLLGLARGREVHVTSISDDEGKALELAGRAAELFESHGVKVAAHGVRSSAHPADVLAGELDGLNAGMLVMGAFSHHGLVHRVFIGSATKRLLQRCPVPLFVHH